jgi:hypothetical protein
VCRPREGERQVEEQRQEVFFGRPLHAGGVDLRVTEARSLDLDDHLAFGWLGFGDVLHA